MNVDDLLKDLATINLSSTNEVKRIIDKHNAHIVTGTDDLIMFWLGIGYQLGYDSGYTDGVYDFF